MSLVSSRLQPQLLSKKKLPAQEIRGLEADLALKSIAAVRLAQTRETAFKAETLRTLNERHSLASTKYSKLRADATKATQRERQTQLTAPVAGVIQQLAIHSVGGVVTSAQPLMIVVPDSPTAATASRASMS